jgi:hypothetical protein
MSIMTEVFAIPSRVRGVYRYMLQVKGQRMKHEDLEHTLSPVTVKSDDNSAGDDRKMVHQVINEMMKMGLLEKQEDDVVLSPSLPDVLRDRTKGDQAFPHLMMDLFTSSTNQENREFARLLAWYMIQDAYDAPYDFKRFEEALQEQVGQHKLGCTNSNPFDQFVYWSVFCGFAWWMDLGESRLNPDPTEYLRNLLPELFSGETTLLFTELVQRLAQRCPVFEQGTIRKELAREFQLEQLEANHLSSVSSLAWLRLQDEGYLKLEMRSDADVVVVWDGVRQIRYSHVTWIKRRERA